MTTKYLRYKPSKLIFAFFALWLLLPVQSYATKDKTRIYQENQAAKKLFDAIQELLKQISEQRNQAKDLPSRKDYLVAVPPWTETREDRAKIIRRILDSALEIVTEGPVNALQERIKKRRKAIQKLRAQIAVLKEKKLDVPKSSLLPFTETQATLEAKIDELKSRINNNNKDIDKTRQEIRALFSSKDITISDEQLNLLLGSVLSEDVIKLMTAFDAARLVDKRLGKLMAENNEDLSAARRYFAMHSALFAMLLHAQDEIIHKIDTVYMKKLDKILGNITQARRKTQRLLREPNRSDQKRILLANLKAQNFSERVAVFYRDYLRTQRKRLTESRDRTARDLKIADNTFETVEATFQLRTLIEDAKTTFKTLERLEAPGFDQIFQNKQLRKEFENLTDKLAVPSS